MKNYTIDFNANKLTVSKSFYEKAMNPNNAEYTTLLVLKNDFPGLRIYIKETPKRKSPAARLTYDKMVKYLACQKNGEALLLMFNTIKEQSKSQSAPYMYVKKWFLEQFPDYTKYPSFDENGKLLDKKAPSGSTERAVNLGELIKVGDAA